MAITVGGDSEGEPMADINVTPLVDVMLVLLIIFIITIRVIIQQVPVELPKATNLPTQTKPENITIAIDKQGGIYWNTKLLSGQDELKAKLRGIVAVEPQPEVHIRGDSNVRYQFVGQVLVATQQIGIRKVAFITTPDHFGQHRRRRVLVRQRVIDLHGMRHAGNRDDENDQQHQHDVDQRRHIDIGVRLAFAAPAYIHGHALSPRFRVRSDQGW